MRPLVSVIVPTYNYASFLGDCLASVLNQTFESFELIVVDDGSTDGTDGLVAAIRDDRVRGLRMPHRGCYAARNAGIEAARGDLIAFLDADDIWVTTKLANQVAAFERWPEIDFCFSRAFRFRDRDGSVAIVPHRQQDCFQATTADQAHIREVLARWFPVNMSTAVVRRRCLETVGPFDTAHPNGMDLDLWFRVCMNVSSAYLHDVLALSRVHDRNHSGNPRMAEAFAYVVDKVMRAPARQYRFMTDSHRSAIRRQLIDRLIPYARYNLRIGRYDAARRCLAMRPSGTGSLRDRLCGGVLGLQAALGWRGPLLAYYRLRGELRARLRPRRGDALTTSIRMSDLRRLAAIEVPAAPGGHPLPCATITARVQA